MQAALSPIYEEEKRLVEVAQEMEQATRRVIRPKAEREELAEGFGQELDIADLEEEIREQGAAGERKLQALQDELGQEVDQAAEAAARVEEKRRELRRRMESAADEGEKRRLMAQLDQVDKEWEQRLARENEAQHKRLRAALEERRRNRKKGQGELATLKEAQLVEGAGQALEDIIRDDQGGAEERGKLLIDKINAEFSPGEHIQATEGYLDRAHQAELMDLTSALFAERSKVLKKLVVEMMTQKQGEYDLVAAEFEPQYRFLKDKKSKGLITPADYRARLEKLSEEESDRKVDAEIEFNEKEQRLQDEVEGLRVEKEAALKAHLKKHQHIERKSALQELQRMEHDSDVLAQYLEEQQRIQEKEVKQFQRQVEKEKQEKLQAIEGQRQKRLQELKEKEELLVGMEDKAKGEEEKAMAQFTKQKEAILKQKQGEQAQELTRGMSQEEAAKIMARHKEDMARLETTLAGEQGRQADAMRERIKARREKNKEAASQKIQRQIKMAAVAKRKAEQRAVAIEVGGLEETDEASGSKAALEKCMSKVGHMTRVIFKGGFSSQPEQRRRVVERTLMLQKRLNGADPLAAILQEVAAMQAGHSDSGHGHRGSLARSRTARESTASAGTVLLSEAGFPVPEQLTFKELQEHIGRLEQGYTDVAAHLDSQGTLSGSSQWGRMNTRNTQHTQQDTVHTVNSSKKR